jgi:PadR family transcriptional regulator AphA
MPKMSPNAYAVLGLLAARPWSAYELAQHMKTSSNLRQLWPRAESKIYEAPKVLEDLGLATSRKQRVAGRTRTVYRITAKGRRTLRDWLSEPGKPPVFEIEDALKVAYATAGDLEQLHANLERMRTVNLAKAELLAKGTRELLDQGFTIPERLHTSALVAELVRRIGYAVGEWAAWAEESTREWENLDFDAEKEAWARATYQAMVEDAEELLRKRAND